jgi:hypothetical protein
VSTYHIVRLAQAITRYHHYDGVDALMRLKGVHRVRHHRFTVQTEECLVHTAKACARTGADDYDPQSSRVRI